MSSSQIEVDNDIYDERNGDGDSVYSSELESDTTSLNTAVKAHTYENGRRYHAHKEGRYPVPNDEQEQDRMDLEYHYLRMALNGELYTAPLKEKNVQRVLDVGTGTGIWCIDMGDEMTSAEVIGLDLSPIQPTLVPPNVRFEVDDLEEEWTWPDNYFDYVHLRMMAAFVGDWDRVVKQAYRVLKPGGYIELQDMTDYYHSDDGSVPADSYMRRWIGYIDEGTQKFGRHWLDVPELFHAALEKHHFVGVNETSVKIPLGPWPKDKRLKTMGMYARHMKLENAESISLATFTRVLGWDGERMKKFFEEFKKEHMDPKYHPYQRFYCIYAQKPESS